MSDKWDKWYYYKPTPTTTRVTESYRSDPVVIGFLVLVGSIVIALGILVWQAYTYLRFGHWLPLSIVTALQWIDIEWAASPSDWIGFHKFLDATPLSLAIFLTGLVVSRGIAFFDD